MYLLIKCKDNYSISKFLYFPWVKDSAYPATDDELVHSSFPKVTTLNNEKSEKKTIINYLSMHNIPCDIMIMNIAVVSINQ